MKWIEENLPAKFWKGHDEHGWNLMKMTRKELILEAIYEDLDNLTYLFALLKKENDS